VLLNESVCDGVRQALDAIFVGADVGFGEGDALFSVWFLTMVFGVVIWDPGYSACVELVDELANASQVDVRSMTLLVDSAMPLVRHFRSGRAL